MCTAYKIYLRNDDSVFSTEHLRTRDKMTPVLPLRIVSAVVLLSWQFHCSLCRLLKHSILPIHPG